MPKLTTWHILLLFIGIIIKAACVSLLGFLWLASTENGVWQRIVLSDWATRMVVLVSLVIRTVVGLHGVLCISMLSALILEGLETPLAKVAAMSIMRFQNGGAFDLRGFLFLLRGGKPTVKRALLAGSSGLLFALLVGLQFTSTALLSDFGMQSVISRQPEREYSYTWKEGEFGVYNQAAVALSSSMMMTTPSYPAFVEYSEPLGYDLPDGAFDTGTLIRGFLPIDQEANRSDLARYSGMATFFDNRVACLRPSANLTDVQLRVSVSNSTFNPLTSGGSDSQSATLEFVGSVGSAITIPKLSQGTQGLNFSCTGVLVPVLVPATGRGDLEWPLAICTANGDPGASFSPMNDTSSSSLFVLNTSYEGLSLYDELQSMGNMGRSVVLDTVSMYDTGEWLHVQFSRGFEVSISTCYLTNAAQMRNATISRVFSNTSEPSSSWNSSRKFFETEAIRRQLGATSTALSISQRGLFELSEPPDSWVAYSERGYIGQGSGYLNILWKVYPRGLYSVFSRANLMNRRLPHETQQSSSLCYSCYPTYAPLAPDLHFGHVAVFTDILRDTRSPGKALQALLTSFNAQLYYSQAPVYAGRANGTAWVRVHTPAPVQAMFFTTIVVAVAIETALVICITLAFIRGTCYSSLGNAWQAISQVTGNEVDKWRTNSLLTDKEIMECMKREGLTKRIIRLVDKGDDKIRAREEAPSSPQSGVSLLSLGEIPGVGVGVSLTAHGGHLGDCRYITVGT